MAAGAWKTYEAFVEHMEAGTIDLDGDTFKIALLTDASNAGTLTHDEFGDLTNELSAGSGYTAGGETLANSGVTRSGRVLTFDADDVVWTASGGDIGPAGFAVIYKSGTAGGLTNPLVCVSEFTETETATDGNTFTVTIHASGVLTVSGGS